ncbi:MAG: hypothetical protein ACRDLS_09015 [Solirubrobacteraceae bacterium]
MDLAPASDGPSERPGGALAACPHCGGDWLAPIEFAHTRVNLWAVTALCPSCCIVTEMVLDKHEVETVLQAGDSRADSLRAAIWRDP